MKYFIVLVLCGIKLFAVSGYRCPNRWLDRPGGDSCYRLWPSPLKTWDDARAACQAYDGELLKLDSQDEKDWLIKEIIKYPASYEWWIGLNNKEDLNTWVWADGTPRNDTFILWGSGEPNNYRGEERCAEIWDNLLNDKNCRQPLQYICERRKDLPLRCDVDGGWDGLTPDSCYKLFDKRNTFETAKAVCDNHDASLLTHMDDEKIQKLLTDFLQGEGQEAIWLGLKYEMTHTVRGFDWQWQDGVVLSNNQWWRGGRPLDESIKNESLNCVVLNVTISGYGNWQALGCDEEVGFICRKPSGTCPNTWQQHQSACFRLDSRQKTTWNEARGSCNLQGASLPEVTSSAFKSFITKFIKSDGPGASVWINWQGKLSDFDSDIVKDDSLEEGEAGCAYLTAGSLSWQLGDCGTLKTVLCTVAVNTPVIPPSDMLPQYECPLSWIKRDNMCYIVRYDALSWPAARLECQQVGGDLVIMNDRDTLDYVADLVNQEIWIGLNDRDTDEKYVWQDTTHEPSTTFWKKKEINSHIIGGRYLRNCVAMVNRQWITYPCSFKLGYVCQKRAEYNIAPGKRATQSSLYEMYDAQRAIEGCATRHFSSACCSHTTYESNPWWEMDMGTTYEIGRILIHRRYDGGCETCKERLYNFRLFLSNTSKTTDDLYMVFQDTRPKPPPEITIDLKSPVTARYLRIDIPDRTEYLSLCEVQVFQAKDIYSRILSPTNSNCFMDSMKWNGSISHTVTGRKCQKWIKDTPHQHNYHIDNRFPEGSQAGAKSYCRDPVGDGTPWCYTVDPDVRWQYCGIPQCASNTDQDNVDSRDAGGKNCGVGWHENPKTGQCYKIGREKLCWSDAASSCEVFGGTLTVTEDEEEHQFIKEWFSKDIFSLKLELIWLGIHDTAEGVRWKSIIKNLDISSLPLSQLSGPVRNSNCVASKTDAVWQSSLVINDCSNRLPYVCKRLGKFRKLYTGASQKMVSLKDKNILDLKKTSILTFSFKGESSASLMLVQNIDDSKSIFEIIIDGYSNTRSLLRKNGETKITSFEKNLVSATEFRDFWLSWDGGNIKVGKGWDINRNVFMEWSDDSLDSLTDIVIHSVDGKEGFWSCVALKEPKNIAFGKEVRQSSVYSRPEYDALRAIDGCKSTEWNSGCCTHTENDFNPWWRIDLGKVTAIKEIVITRRWDSAICRPRMNGFRVFVGMAEYDYTIQTMPIYTSTQDEPGPVIRIPLKKGTAGRYVRIDIPGRNEYLTLCEVEIFEDLDTDLPHCGPEWTVYPAGHKCYKLLDERKTWDQAQDRCSDMDGALAPITSAEEQLFIFEKMRKISAIGFWFDARRSSEDSLQLSNGSLVQYKDDLTFSSLWPGGRGDCFSILLEWDYGNGMWVDFDCSAGMASVCTKREKELTTTSTTITTSTTTTASTTTAISDNIGCPDGWLKNPERSLCFRIVREFADWYTARDKCKEKNGHLAVFMSPKDQEFFKALFHMYHITTGDWDAVWIDGTDLKEEGLWKLSSGQSISTSLSWWPGTPDDFQNNEDCLSSLTSFERAGKLNDAPCTYTLQGYICQSELKSCEAGWTYDELNGNCYMIFHDKLSWHDSETACKQEGASLTSIISRREQQFVAGLLDGMTDVGAWVGAHDIRTEAQWIWSDGQPWFDGIKWAYDQPDNWQDAEDCGMLRTWDERGDLNDLKCAAEIPYMCMKKATVRPLPQETTPTSTVRTTTTTATTTTTSTTTTTGLSSTNCGPGWEEAPHLKYCYQFNTDRKGFLDAFTTCLDQDSLPVSIVSPAEQAYVSGEPNTEISGPGALSQSPDSHLQWKVRPWKDELCYICKRERLKILNVTTTPTPLSSIPPDSGYLGCKGKGWVDYKTSCYLFGQEKIDWNGALKYCRAQGGDLASVADKDESDFIFSQLPKDYCFNIWKNDSECNFWAESGECGKNPTWMARHCHRACNYCYHDCRDKYNSEKCMEWAKMDECDANPKWMHPNCAQSCGICYGAPTRGFWLGMTKRTHSQVYSWSDLSKPSFTLWAKGQPKNFASSKSSCCAMFLQTGAWNDGFCTDLLSGLVCKKPKSQISTTPMSPFKVGCPEDNSLGYEQYCYTYSKEGMSWSDAESSCVTKGGHLAAITNRFIQAFLSSELVGRNTNHWIGLRDATDSMSPPSWSSGQQLIYTHFSKEISAGLEILTPDEYKYRVVGIDISDASSIVFEVKACNDAHILLMTNVDDEDNDIYEIVIGGWGNTKSVIRTSKQQDPPAASLTHKPLDCAASKAFWVSWARGQLQVGSGMTVGADKFLSYSGHSSPTVNFIAVSTGFGSSGTWAFDVTFQTECYAMTSNKPVGLWKPTPCNIKLPYICQSLREGYTTPMPTTTPMTTPVPCPDSWAPFENYCYMASSDGKPDSWFNAGDQCAKFGGNLASIHSSAEADFLASLFYDYDDDVYTIWIGINDNDFENSFVWTDGSSLNYHNWAYSEPNNVNGDEHCGELVFSSTEWNDNVCYLSRHYVCKIPRGFEIPVTSNPAMTTTNDVCGDDWIQFYSYCYFHGKDDLKTWHDAGQFCRDNGAELASIHEEDELHFLMTQVSKHSVGGTWLGMNDLNLDGTFQWSDGTPENFFFWDDGEPNDYKGNEKCVDMKTSNGRWNDLNCNTERPFICKRPAGGTVTIQTTTTEAPDGGCYPGFSPFGSRCYYISDGSLLIWIQAQVHCRDLGTSSRLVSIHNSVEQAYLTTQLFGKSDSYWIGMDDVDGHSSFQWSDNSALKYTNWDKYAPKSQHITKYPCVAMVNSETTRPGVWNNYQCYMEKGFICVSPKFADLPTPSPTRSSENEGCNAGYRAFGSYCYKLVTQKQTWYQALDTCRRESTELASIVDYYEQAFIEVLIEDPSENVWIGISVNADGTIIWTDNKEVSIMLLEINSPVSSCGVVRGSVWLSIDCQLMYRSVCKYRRETTDTTSEEPSTIPTTKESFRYVCKEDYFSYNDACYYIVAKDVKDFQRAQGACRDMNMTLTSIHSKEENDYIEKILGDKVRNEVIQTAWIGLKKVQWKAAEEDHAYFLWTDESPVTFLDKTKSDGSADDLNIQYGYLEYHHHWKLGGESQQFGYICKGKPDVIEWLTTSTTTTTTTSRATLNKSTRWPLFPFSNRVTPKLPPFHHHYKADKQVSDETSLSPGKVAGIIIGILGFLFIVAVIVYVIWKNWRPSWRYEMDTSLGFDNALFHKTNETVSLNE